MPGAQQLAFFYYLGNRMRCAGDCILTEGGAQEPLNSSTSTNAQHCFTGTEVQVLTQKAVRRDR